MEFRKHLGWYTKGIPGGKQLRQELFKVSSLRDMECLLQTFMEGYSPVST